MPGFFSLPEKTPLKTTLLSLTDSLPLTCSRAGSCCHGNLVRLNPWELAQLAVATNMSPGEFKEWHTIAGGSVLHFNGKPNRTGKKSCSLYVEGEGCSVHPARPLACRLFPLGRQIQNEQASYLFQGTTFPCLKECPEVLNLPHVTVGDYLAGQQTAVFEQAQDGYMEVMQNVADIAFTLLLETGLAESGDTRTLSLWRKLGNMSADGLATFMGAEWLRVLTLPDLEYNPGNSLKFVRIHNQLIEEKVQVVMETLTTFDELHEAAGITMAMALFLGHSLGANAPELSEYWIEIAKSNGAVE